MLRSVPEGTSQRGNVSTLMNTEKRVSMRRMYQVKLNPGALSNKMWQRREKGDELHNQFDFYACCFIHNLHRARHGINTPANVILPVICQFISG
jgi:REP element-mobilizing transposase RayT